MKNTNKIHDIVCDIESIDFVINPKNQFYDFTNGSLNAMSMLYFNRFLTGDNGPWSYPIYNDPTMKILETLRARMANNSPKHKKITKNRQIKSK